MLTLNLDIQFSSFGQKEQLYITGGQLVNSDHIQFANILIEDGKIVSTGTNIEVQPDTPRLDATGMLIMPAGIDMSTYLIQDIHPIDTEAYINFTKEALLGGTTTIVDTIICPKDSSAVDLLIKYKNTFKETKFWCDIIIRIGFMEIQENHLNEIEQLAKQHGINSFLLKLRSIEKCIVLVTSTNCPVIFSSINEMNIIERISKIRRQIPPIHITVCCTSNSLLSEITHNQFIIV
uniref:Dihydropyrimidinase-related protein 3 n=1 Tax=Schistosoma haematobium TaxID=6185 RepID=A0A094ZZ65_SCHHA